MRYHFIFAAYLFFSLPIRAQSPKSLPVVCITADPAKGHPAVSSISLYRSAPTEMAEQIWYYTLNGKPIFNFRWKRNVDSQIVLTEDIIIKSVIIKLDNNSLIELFPNSRPRIEQQKFLWALLNISIAQLKQCSKHKMLAITIVTGGDQQYQLFTFNEEQQLAIQSASACFFDNIK